MEYLSKEIEMFESSVRVDGTLEMIARDFVFMMSTLYHGFSYLYIRLIKLFKLQNVLKRASNSRFDIDYVIFRVH